MTLRSSGLHGAHRRCDLESTIGRAGVRRLVRQQRLAPYSRYVLIERALADDFRCRAAAALLRYPSAVLTGPSAAAVHGSSAAGTVAVHLLSRHYDQIHRRPGLVPHHGTFDDAAVTVVDGLRLLDLPHTVADVLCTLPPPDALACADQLLAMVADRDRAGLRAEVGHLIESRRNPRWRARGEMLLELARGDAESPAESWLMVLLTDAELPVPVQQFSISNADGSERYRLDFAWEQPRVALEYDGYEAHLGRAEADQARAADLRRRGWIVIRVDAGVFRDPTTLVAQVRQAFERRGFAA